MLKVTIYRLFKKQVSTWFVLLEISLLISFVSHFLSNPGNIALLCHRLVEIVIGNLQNNIEIF